MTSVVGMALGQRPIPPAPQPTLTTANFLLAGGAPVSMLVCFDSKASYGDGRE